MRRWALSTVLVFAVAALVSCTDAESPGLSSEQRDDPALVLGEQLYQAHCATCHGNAGGGGAAPKLADGRVERDFPDPAAQEELVRDGFGSMPAWEGKLTDDEIAAVVRYTREVL
jgi:mono/diheme cytochrome c family protein